MDDISVPSFQSNGEILILRCMYPASKSFLWPSQHWLLACPDDHASSPGPEPSLLVVQLPPGYDSLITGTAKPSPFCWIRWRGPKEVSLGIWEEIMAEEFRET